MMCKYRYMVHKIIIPRSRKQVTKDNGYKSIAKGNTEFCEFFSRGRVNKLRDKSISIIKKTIYYLFLKIDFTYQRSMGL